MTEVGAFLVLKYTFPSPSWYTSKSQVYYTTLYSLQHGHLHVWRFLAFPHTSALLNGEVRILSSHILQLHEDQVVDRAVAKLFVGVHGLERRPRRAPAPRAASSGCPKPAPLHENAVVQNAAS